MRLNELIRVPQVRLIDEDGNQMGVVSIEDARQRALDTELDLVEIAPNAEPPVCRIMDFGKFKYQQQKKLHEQRKKHHGQEMKQIRIKTFRIDPHDLSIKLKQAREFLEDGNRLLFNMMFKAREHNHADLGRKLLLEEVAKPLEDIAKVDSPPSKQGRRMTMMLSPLPNIQKIVAQRKAREEAEVKAAAKEAAAEAAAPQEDAPAETPDAPEESKPSEAQE